MTTEATKTEVGSYFISNYPPYSQWKKENLPAIVEVMNQPPRPGVPLGLIVDRLPHFGLKCGRQVDRNNGRIRRRDAVRQGLYLALLHQQSGDDVVRVRRCLRFVV